MAILNGWIDTHMHICFVKEIVEYLPKKKKKEIVELVGLL